MRARAALAAAALAALSGCGPRGAANLCGAIKVADVEEALGASLQGESQQAASLGPQIACAWSGQSPEGGARTLALTVQRDSGAGAYDLAAEDLRARYTRVGTLADIGDAAIMGVGQADATGFSGQIVARKGGDLLVLRIDGRDPAAFEAVARAAAQAM
ncbi:MAG TPA: hypothetical protein VG735_12455 [Caulobacterales bacterium]|nr:hypothetical protein [Caulobacterales bacterium]